MVAVSPNQMIIILKKSRALIYFLKLIFFSSVINLWVFPMQPEGIVQQYSTSTFIQLSDGRQYNGSLTVSLPPKNHLVPDSAFVEVTAIGLYF